MKKIYFALFISLLFNLFVGCASTSARNNQPINYLPEHPQFDVSRYILPKPEERQFFVDNPRFRHRVLQANREAHTRSLLKVHYIYPRLLSHFSR